MTRTFFFALIAIFAQASGLAAQASCELPQPGRWLLETGATTTPTGAGGGPDRAEFTMQVKDCGASLVLTDFGPAMTGKVKVMSRGSDGLYAYTILFDGVPITVQMGLDGTERMTGSWNFGGMAHAPGTATFLGASLGGRDPRCDCPAFVNRLRGLVESAEYWMSLYADPRLSARPEGLDPSVAWTQPQQEDLISMIGDDIPYAEAVQALNPGGVKPAPPPAPQSTGDDAVVESGPGRTPLAGVAAYTSCGSCRIHWGTRASGCGADIANQATETHEGLHSASCKTAKATWEASNYAVDVPTYCEMVRDPAFNSQNEIAAYQAEIAFVENRYAALCGEPLR